MIGSVRRVVGVGMQTVRGRWRQEELDHVVCFHRNIKGILRLRLGVGSNFEQESVQSKSGDEIARVWSDGGWHDGSGRVTDDERWSGTTRATIVSVEHSHCSCNFENDMSYSMFSMLTDVMLFSDCVPCLLN